MKNRYLDTFIKIIQNVFISDMYKGCVGDMGELGITESLSVKRQVFIRQFNIAMIPQNLQIWLKDTFQLKGFECTYVVLRIFKPATVINVKQFFL